MYLCKSARIDLVLDRFDLRLLSRVFNFSFFLLTLLNSFVLLTFFCTGVAQPLSKLLRSFAGAVSSDTRNVKPRSRIRRRLMRMVECNEMMSALS